MLNHNQLQPVCENQVSVISSNHYENDLTETGSRSRSLVVVVIFIVVCLHIVALYIMLTPSSIVMKKIMLPTIVGVLIQKPSTDRVKISKNENIKPKLKPKPKQKKIVQPKKKPTSDKEMTLTETVVDAPIVSDVVEETELEDDLPELQQAPIISPRSDASHLNNRAPVYPRASLRRHEEGKVILKLLIRADGTVGELWVKQSSGHKRLDKAALKAVKRWRYEPARQGDEAIDFWYQQPFVFSMKK